MLGPTQSNCEPSFAIGIEKVYSESIHTDSELRFPIAIEHLHLQNHPIFVPFANISHYIPVCR